MEIKKVDTWNMKWIIYIPKDHILSSSDTCQHSNIKACYELRMQ